MEASHFRPEEYSHLWDAQFHGEGFKMAKLIVFVHGLGADDYDWWGSTRTQIIERYQSDEETDVFFYNYKTEKVSGIINRVKLLFGFGTNLADLEGLGGLLSAAIDNKLNGKDYEEIKLFGHSMGGIVIASALWKIKNNLVYSHIYNKVSSVALCGTPLGGSLIAARISRIPWTASKQAISLKYQNKTLVHIVNNFSSIVSIDKDEEDKPSLVFFVIEDDEVVQGDNEKFNTFPVDVVRISSYSMSGGHVGAVQNLTIDSDEFNNIVTWIEKEEILDGIPEDKVENFKSFMDNRTFSKEMGISKLKLKEMYFKYMNMQDKKRPYLNLSVHARRTYLCKRRKESENLAITDFKRIVKVVDNTKECIFEIKNGFLKESIYGSEEKLNSLIELLKDDSRIQKVDRFCEVVLNLGYRVNGGERLFKPKSIEFESYENDDYKGFNIVCSLGHFAVGDEIEFLASLTLPVTIFDFPKEKDSFSFPGTTYDRKYIIQEEIYGNNDPKLEPNEVSSIADVNAQHDRNLYYNRYIFSSINDNNFNKIEISYNMRSVKTHGDDPK